MLRNAAAQTGAPLMCVQVATRGGMLHLVLQLCRHFEDAFAKCVDGGKNGGEIILTVRTHSTSNRSWLWQLQDMHVLMLLPPCLHVLLTPAPQMYALTYWLTPGSTCCSALPADPPLIFRCPANGTSRHRCLLTHLACRCSSGGFQTTSAHWTSTRFWTLPMCGALSRRQTATSRI